MRLLLVTQDFPPNTGGIETYCFELARRFVTSTEHFAVLAPSHRDAKSVDHNLAYPVYRIPVKDSLLPLMAPVPEIYHSIKEKFDTVLHAQWQTVGASIWAKKFGYPEHIYVASHARELLISPFAGNEGWVTDKLHHWRKKMFQKADGFFPVSHYTASLLQDDGVSKQKIHVVGNGTDPEVYYPQKTGILRQNLQLDNKKVILTICRLVPRKGIDLVLKALKSIKEQRQDVVYLIGGTGPDEQRLRSLVSELELDDDVQFLGRIPDDKMAAYYSLGNVFVMPARNDPPDVEGFGIVFLEANACETAVIGSNTGGIPDAVIHGETGYLIEENNLNQLTDFLTRLLTDEELARKMGRKGRKRILNEATWDHVAESVLQKMRLINQNQLR